MVKALDLKSNGNFPGTIEPCPQRSIFFSEIYSGEVENTNQYLYSQATETDEPKILNYFSWKGHVGDSVWKRPARQFSAKKSKISASKKLYEDGIRFHQNKINVNRATMPQWLRRWTWNPMATSRARSSPARSRWSHFQKYIQKKLGTRTNTCVRKQLRLTNQRSSILPFLERTCRRQRLETTSTTILSQKNRRLAQAKICPTTESDSIKTRLMSL